MDQTIKVILNRKVRPLRLAFLVQPSSHTQLLRAIQINTVLWGGQLNPLIPVYQRTPSSWERKPFKPPRAKDVIEGYLRAFDPDFVVNMTGRKIALEAYPDEGYRQKRMLSPDDVLSLSDPDNPISYGVDVTEIYRYLYAEEFRFQQKDPLRVVLPESSDNRLSLLLAACFGSFPKDEKLGYFKQQYLQAFSAESVNVQPKALHELFQRSCGTPLRMSSAFLEVARRRVSSDDATLFYLDAASNLDIIDYWNLRAAGWLVLPVPKQWAGEMADSVLKFSEEHYQPYRHNPQMMHHTTLQKGRSLTDEEVTAYRNSVKVPKGEMLVMRTWYPRIWDDWAREKDFVVPAEVYSKEADVDVQYSGSSVIFKDKGPEFAERFGGRGEPRWANVLVFKSYGASGEHAQVIPVGLRDIARAIGTPGTDQLRAGKDGLVLACQYDDFTHYWEPPASLAIFEAWARQRGHELTFSAAGKITQQLLRQIGGVWGAWSFADVNILKLIEKMAGGTAISAGEMSNRTAGTNKRELGPSNRLQFFVERQALRIGIEIQCEHCQQRTWYALDQIRADLQCEKCLNYFKFPADKPPASPWYYKVAGAFSIPGYCHGAYCVALALKLFTQTLHATTTAVPSFNLKGRDGSKLEADFGLFYRSNAWFDPAPYTIFGECKTFDRFAPDDVRRMRKLGKSFPGSVLVFCTLNDELTATEKRLLRPLARSGRKYLGGDKWLNPVLILTRTELFNSFPPDYAWRDLGGKYAKFAEQHRRVDTLPDLCDETQQLYLDMEPYATTVNRQVEKRRARLVQRRTAAPGPT